MNSSRGMAGVLLSVRGCTGWGMQRGGSAVLARCGAAWRLPTRREGSLLVSRGGESAAAGVS